MAEKKYVYSFKEAHAAHLGKDILGGKGAGLCEMTAAGVNIPAGFTITTEACTLYYDSGKKFRMCLESIVKHLHEVEKVDGKTFGAKDGIPASGLRSFRRPSIDAGHDGHHLEPRLE